MKRRLAALLVALASLFGAQGPVSRAAHAAVDVTAAELQLIDLLNADRSAAGLPPLAADPRLMDVARWRSEDMAALAYFSHDVGNVPGRVVFDVLRAQGVRYRAAGENLARTSGSAEHTAAVAEAALMESPTHRANILRPDYTHLGVGVAIAPDGRVLYTQLFKTAW